MSEELADYAVRETSSRGRKFPEETHPYRSAFERDRDRIIHSEAFRRLEGKTQVFTPGINDNYRNRLTHSLEVAQIGRTIAKALKLNESLTEAVCLGHDLGHSPFGHGGEQVLNELMADFGGFEHNRQSLRIVDLLEHPYPNFVGLNLMYETRLGLAKHKGPYDLSGDIAFSEQNCSLEGQAADVADRIAYNCHDLEDGMRAGLIDGEQLRDIKIFADAQDRINARTIQDKTTSNIRTAKAIIDKLVSDCICASQKTLRDMNVKTIRDVYIRGKNLIAFSDKSCSEIAEMEKFLMENFYQYKTLIKTTEQVKSWLVKLFEGFCQKPTLMPDYFRRLIETEGLQRTVCDYIAGMTDRFCLKMLEKI